MNKKNDTKYVRKILSKTQNPSDLPKWLLNDLFDESTCYIPKRKKPYSIKYLNKKYKSKVKIGTNYQAILPKLLTKK